MLYIEESILKNSQFIGGTHPSTLDKSMFELLKYCLYENMQLMDQKPIEIKQEVYPYTFAWFNLINQF